MSLFYVNLTNPSTNTNKINRIRFFIYPKIFNKIFSLKFKNF